MDVKETQISTIKLYCRFNKFDAETFALIDEAKKPQECLRKSTIYRCHNENMDSLHSFDVIPHGGEPSMSIKQVNNKAVTRPDSKFKHR